MSDRFDPSTTTIAFEALPSGDVSQHSDEYLLETATHFNSDVPNPYVRVARLLQNYGFLVIGLESQAHRPTFCSTNKIKCAVHRMCLKTKKRCIEDDWVDIVNKLSPVHNDVVVLMGKLHEKHFIQRLILSRLLRRRSCL